MCLPLSNVCNKNYSAKLEIFSFLKNLAGGLALHHLWHLGERAFPLWYLLYHLLSANKRTLLYI